jgi:predicted ATPase/class 3 adenylate cyclase
MDSPSIYIPMDRRHAMIGGSDLPDRTYGSAVLADISGFTALTGLLLEEMGPTRGAEEVLRQINPIYDQLIAELHRYHGSVINFAGDSITCWLDGDDGLRAVACAMAMQQLMANFETLTTPSGKIVTLAIKVGVATGPVRRFVVGDPEIQLVDVLAGATLDKMAMAEGLADKKEVVVNAEVVHNNGGTAVFDVSEWRHGENEADQFAVLSGMALQVSQHPWSSLLSTPEEIQGRLSENQLKSWLLNPVYERLKSGGDFLAELRPAVALFLKFSGIDFDADDAGPQLDAYVHWVQNILVRHEGYLLQVTVGDKGSYLYAAFGAPLAHDDDPERAVAAALELQRTPAAFNFMTPPQIGISQGRMWSGACGATTRRTYGVMGNETNMAARLMSNAQPGQILVSKRVAQMAERRYRFNHLEPIVVKGKTKPFPVSEVLSHQTGSLRRPATMYAHPLVGRDGTLEQMAALLEKARVEGMQILKLEGPAGVGKSHLVAMFAENALDLGWQIAFGNCQSINQEKSYYPWQQIFWSLLNLSPDPVPGEDSNVFITRQVQQVTQTFTGMNPEWLVRLPLLGDLLDLPIPDNATTAAFEPRLRQRALFALVTEMLTAWSKEKPLLLLVEDSHWIDEASIDLISSFSRTAEAEQILLVVAQRPPRQENAGTTGKAELENLPHYHTIDLSELSQEGVASLVSHRLQGNPSPLALSFIQAKAQGNPFFVEELVGALKEADRIRLQEDGTWELAPPVFHALRDANMLKQVNNKWVLHDNASLSAVDLGIPVSIHGTVLSRIDRLPESHKLTLKTASVIGRNFELTLLEKSHPVSPEINILQEQVEEMTAREFIRPEQDQSAYYAFLFKHNITQEVAYETLLFAQRRELHKAVGQAMEMLHPEAVEQIAYHAFTGQDWGRAFQYQLAAGKQAFQLFVNQPSIDHFQKALQSAAHLPASETLEDRQYIHTTLGELLTTTGQLETAREHLDKAVVLAEERSDMNGKARACRWIARIYENQGEYQPALSWIQTGLFALTSQETAEAVELMLTAGLINTRQGDYENALSLCYSSLEIGRKINATTVIARAYNLLGVITRLRGNSAEAIEYFQKSYELYEAASNIHGQALAQNQIATAHFDLGQWPEADHYYRQARTVFNQLGDIYNSMAIDNNLGGIALNQGRLDEALLFYQEALHAQEQIGRSLWILGVLHMNLGHTFVRRGEVFAARRFLETSRDYFNQAQARDFLPEMHRHFAEMSLLARDLPEAVEHAQSALNLSREMAMRGEEGSSLRVMGAVTIAQSNYEQAEQYLVESAAILEEVADEYEWARSQLLLAHLYLERDKMALVEPLLEKAEEVFERLEASIDLRAVQRLRQELSKQ